MKPDPQRVREAFLLLFSYRDTLEILLNEIFQVTKMKLLISLYVEVVISSAPAVPRIQNLPETLR